ncbi:MAG: aspartate-semialdehyde dehydrogenase, partial [Candidatus Cloacimonadaceae bacterium]|nr:aspartate-semialdehyde dehydrogenase [Candidatus Cloacimonadaceae bacterium]
MNIAIVGATGEVGRMMIHCLSEQNIKISNLDLYSSARSAGAVLYLNDQPITVQELTTSSLLKHYDYVLFSAGAGVAHSFAPLAIAANSVVIDNSSAFRKETHIPLVVPEINGDLLTGYYGIIANPNCSTIQVVLPLAILDRAYDLKKVVFSTYQSVSGSGHTGISAMLEQRKGSSDKGIYPRIIDQNVIPQIGGFDDNGYTQEEMKMQNETRKILRKEEIEISATAVRVPVLYGHSVSVYAEFDTQIDLPEVEKLFYNAASIEYNANSYITPREIGNSDNSHISRLRYGCDKKSLCFWNVAHNV